MAVVGVFVTVVLINNVFKISLPVFPFYIIATTLTVYNLVFFALLIHLEKNASFPVINRMANAQIGIDLFILTVLLHFSGGIENPFIFFFIFHMIIAGILLSRRASFLQATYAVGLFCLMAITEYLGILPHFSLKGFILQSQYNHLPYAIGVTSVFISTLYIAVFLATSISAELRQREKILEEANELLQEKDRIKSEYVLRVSHDIKSDLATIKTCLEPVVNGLCGKLDPSQSNLLERALRRTGKLLFFVQALLRITKMKLLKELKMEWFSFEDVLSEAIAVIAPKAEEKNIAIECALDPVVKEIFGIREYIFETVQNILANAVKYTPPQGRVEISVGEKENNTFIRIADTGIGIPKNEMSKIFEEFFRASNAKNIEKDGTGLGLSIVKQVVDLHHGKVWIESEEGKGTQINIELPK
jgi:signal transduction histidine kinase